MERKMQCWLWAVFVLFMCLEVVNSRVASVTPGIRSDVIVTRFEPKSSETNDDDRPGIMRRTLIKFGQVVSKVGNNLGKHTVKVTSVIEKLCEIIKTVVPVISAVCSVGQFQFCSATDVSSSDLNAALSPSPSDLDILDK